MRTTVNIDDDVMAEVRRQARRRDESIGDAVTRLIRQGLLAEVPAADPDEEGGAAVFEARFGFRPLPRRDGPLATDALVDELREELGI